jgi:hypothetical protein
MAEYFEEDVFNYYAYNRIWTYTEDYYGLVDKFTVEWDNGWYTATDVDQYGEGDWAAYTIAANPYTGDSYTAWLYDDGTSIVI